MRARLVTLLIAAPGFALAEPQPSPVIFPAQQLPLSFSHVQHAKAGCGYCHDDAAHSRRAADVLVPTEATCATCHEIEPGKCATCHPGWNGAGAPPRVVVPPPNLRFNHELHSARGVRCATCHAVATVGLATRAQLPRMPSCLGCHDGKTAPAACPTCHITDGGGTLRTEFSEGQLVPAGTLRGDAHDLRFRLEHARVAQNDERYCANCHQRAFCTDCHDGVKKPLDFHGNDYVALHPIDARRATTDCSGCHRLQTFCTGCHSRLGVSADPKTSEYVGPTATRHFHPDGWVATGATGDTPRRATSHSFQAQRNLRSCASCHREETCLGCHAAGINPHPAGWSHSRRCAALLARDGRMCLRCHTQVEDVRCD